MPCNHARRRRWPSAPRWRSRSGPCGRACQPGSTATRRCCAAWSRAALSTMPPRCWSSRPLVWARPGFETLVLLPRLRFEPFGYQLQAAGAVLRAMRGRAILADEVGLGKTIEAGLVTSELRLRGLTARTLILVPVGLVEQWQQELDRKFGLPSVLAQNTALQHETGLAEQPLLIASPSTARRAPLPWAASPSAMAPATRTRCAGGCRPARRQSRRSRPHRTLPGQPCRIATACTRRSPST